jgi:glycosyltransferase involved in cell wall biosynthesis
MKKIVIDGRIWGKEHGNIGEYAQQISQKIFERNSGVSFFLFLPKKHMEIEIFPDNVEVIEANESVYSIMGQYVFSRKISKVIGDITWFSHGCVPYLFHRPFISTLHVLQQKRFFSKIFFQRYLKKSQYIITTSPEEKRYIESAFSLPQGKVQVVEHGVSLNSPSQETVENMKRRIQPFSHPLFLVLGGRWEKQKNIFNALYAFDMFRKYGGKGSLLLTGRKEYFHSEILKKIQTLSFSRDIIFMGKVSEDEEFTLLSESNVLLFPSTSKGFPFPIFKAMQFGTTAICSTQLQSMCNGGALYCKSSDPEDIALKMVDALEKKVQEKCIFEGKKNIKQYSWDKMAQKMENILFCENIWNT